MRSIKLLLVTFAILISEIAYAANEPAKNYIYYPNRGDDGVEIKADKELLDP